jgi:hypothetical protein
MKKKLIALLMLILVSMVIMSSSVFAGDKDKYGQWMGPYNGVSLRYVWSYLGQNQWSSYHDYVQFWNANSYKVEITYYVKISEKERGPFVIDLDPSNDTNPGEKVALAEDESVSSITVKPSQ